jgi:hypothetical protein
VPGRWGAIHLGGMTHRIDDVDVTFARGDRLEFEGLRAGTLLFAPEADGVLHVQLDDEDEPARIDAGCLTRACLLRLHARTLARAS